MDALVPEGAARQAKRRRDGLRPVRPQELPPAIRHGDRRRGRPTGPRRPPPLLASGLHLSGTSAISNGLSPRIVSDPILYPPRLGIRLASGLLSVLFAAAALKDERLIMLNAIQKSNAAQWLHLRTQIG